MALPIPGVKPKPTLGVKPKPGEPGYIGIPSGEKVGSLIPIPAQLPKITKAPASWIKAWQTHLSQGATETYEQWQKAHLARFPEVQRYLDTQTAQGLLVPIPQQATPSQPIPSKPASSASGIPPGFLSEFEKRKAVDPTLTFDKWLSAHLARYPAAASRLGGYVPQAGGITYAQPGEIKIPQAPAPLPITPPTAYHPGAWRPTTALPPVPQTVTTPTPPAPTTLTPPPAFQAAPWQEKPLAEYQAAAKAEIDPLIVEQAKTIANQMASIGRIESGQLDDRLERMAAAASAQIAQLANQMRTEDFDRYMIQREQSAAEAAQSYYQWATTTDMDINQQQDLFANQMIAAGFTKEETQRAFDNTLALRQAGFVEYTTQREMALAESAQAFMQWAQATQMSMDQAQNAFNNAMQAQQFNQLEIQRVWGNERQKYEFLESFKQQKELAKMGYQYQSQIAAGQLGLGYAQLAQAQQEFGGLSAWQQAQLDWQREPATTGGDGDGGDGDSGAYNTRPKELPPTTKTTAPKTTQPTWGSRPVVRPGSPIAF